jgi:hypothetical protein
MTASAEWAARNVLSSVAMSDGSIIVLGGYTPDMMTDVWRSTDKGATWTRMSASAGWTPRGYLNSVAMPDGSILMLGGWTGSVAKNDVWRSTDNGATWTEVTSNAGWPGRYGHTTVALPDGSIVMMGGTNGSNSLNDVWRFMPAGSSAKNPSHTYIKPGNYQVSLQVYNADGFTNTQKLGYISVTPVSVKVKIVPNPLNTANKGKFVAFITLPNTYKAADVDPNSVVCEGAPAIKIIKSKWFPRIFAAIFNREQLVGVNPENNVELTVTGIINKNGMKIEFSGSDLINVINKATKNKEAIDDVTKMSDDKIFTQFNTG